MRAVILLVALAAACTSTQQPLPPTGGDPVSVQDPAKCAVACADAQNACPTRAKSVEFCVSACSSAAEDLEGPLSELAIALTCNP